MALHNRGECSTEQPGPQSTTSSAAAAIVSYAKLLTLTGVMAASVSKLLLYHLSTADLCVNILPSVRLLASLLMTSYLPLPDAV